MTRYFMRDTPLQAMEQLMMSQPGQKPEAVEYTAAHSITRPKMWRANTARTMSASIRAACVNAPAWRNGSKQAYWN